jgi:hypothetical protein
MSQFFDRPARTLIAVDLLLIGLAFALAAAAALGLAERGPRFLGLAHDHSLANLWNILKWALVTVILAVLWRNRRSPVLGAAALVFLGVFLDDAFLLHEQANALIADRAGTWAAHDVGVGTLVVLALGAGALMAMAWRRSAPDARSAMQQILVLTLALIAVSGSLDWLASEVSGRTEGSLKYYASFGIGLVEDGSELIFGSLILATTIRLRREARAGLRAF